MKSKNNTIAVAFFVLLIMSSGAQAGNLFALDRDPVQAERQIGLFQQAIQWLGGTWTDLKMAFGENGTPPPPPPSCTDPNPCGPGANGEGGWTIDPDG